MCSKSSMEEETLKDTKGVTSRVNRRRTGKTMAKKARNNELQNTTQKTNDRTTRNPPKHEVNSGAPGGLAVPSIICRVFFLYCQLVRADYPVVDIGGIVVVRSNALSRKS